MTDDGNTALVYVFATLPEHAPLTRLATVEDRISDGIGTRMTDDLVTPRADIQDTVDVGERGTIANPMSGTLVSDGGNTHNLFT